MKENGVIQEYTGSLSRQIREEYHISEEYYHGEIKRGLRNSDGTGVMVGVTKVGSVQGYLLQDGQRIPIPATSPLRPSPPSTTLWRPTGRREPSGSRRWRICC